jgi:transaldolase
MQIFLDSGNIKEIEKWLPFIDGITTNPSILKKDGSSIQAVLDAAYGKAEVSVEVVYPYVDEARKYGVLPGVAVKIPLLNSDGSNNLGVIRDLFSEGIKINCTALFSLGQAIFAAKAGAKYVSLFGGRIEDEGGNQYEIIREVSDFILISGYSCEIIVGSIRGVDQIKNALLSGAHIVTVPPAILEKMLMHRYSIETVRQFERDAEALRNLKP